MATTSQAETANTPQTPASLAPIDLATFDASRALTLRQAIDTGRLAFRGRKPTLSLVQRWANPKAGCRPLGPGTTQIVLPTIITGRERLAMPEWVDWFVRERSRLMVEAARKMLVAPVPPPVPSAARMASRDRRATKRLRELGAKVA